MEPETSNPPHSAGPAPAVAVDELPMPAWWCANGDDRAHFNRTLAQRFALPEADEAPDAMIHPEDRRARSAARREARRAGAVSEVVARWRTASGDGWRWQLECAWPVTDDERGAPIGWVGILKDVDGSRRSETQLFEAYQLHQAVLASTLDPVITMSIDGIVRSASDSVERVFGWRPEDLVGRNIKLLMPEPIRSEHDGYLDEYRRTGRTGILGRTREMTAIHRDGHEFPVAISVSRADPPGQHEPIFVGIIRDITERKEAEAALAESERRIRTMLESIEMLAVTLDAEGRVTFCNDYFLEFVGHRETDVLGAPWFDRFITDEDRDALAAVFARGMQTGDLPSRQEHAILTRVGAPRVISWTITVTRDAHGDAVGATALGVDVTDLRRDREMLEELVGARTRELERTHEQLRQADRLASIGTLAAGLGHDMNNVLFPVKCRLDTIDESTLTPELREHFRSVRSSVEYLQHLSDGLHLLALDADDPDASIETTHLASWWQQVGPLLMRSAPGHANVTVRLPDDVPDVPIPPHRLTQAVLNLVVNASEAIDTGGHIDVWSDVSPDGCIVHLGVTDDGAGMSPEVARRALDPFFTTRKRGLGTGLGLSLVHGVVRASGGTVDIDSTPGEGTTVTLSLPAMRDDDRRPARESGDALRAAVSVDDRRLASLLATLLDAAEVAFENRNDPGDADLWITPATPEALPTARAHLAARGHVVALGPADATWTDAGATVIHEPNDFESLRTGISEAVRTLAERRS